MPEWIWCNNVRLHGALSRLVLSHRDLVTLDLVTSCDPVDPKATGRKAHRLNGLNGLMASLALRSWLLCCSGREGTLLLSLGEVWWNIWTYILENSWRWADRKDPERCCHISFKFRLVQRSRVLSCVLLKQAVIFWHGFASISEVKWSLP